VHDDEEVILTSVRGPVLTMSLSKTCYLVYSCRSSRYNRPVRINVSAIHTPTIRFFADKLSIESLVEGRHVLVVSVKHLIVAVAFVRWPEAGA
jgi:hypothetical protein